MENSTAQILDVAFQLGYVAGLEIGWSESEKKSDLFGSAWHMGFLAGRQTRCDQPELADKFLNN
jgi:hypothetical protein